jgi:nitrite reductase/ring-hydroxylating ferredoxin subunit
MGGALVAAYGSVAAVAGRYLFPARPASKRWIYVARVASLQRGQALPWRTPSGERVSIARVGEGASSADFIALSSTCPHLGCQVRYESQHARFFCPCHNGVFTPEGKAIAGPPAESGLSLGRYPLKVESGLLYMEVPLESVSGSQTAALEPLEADASPRGPGHDPCLDAQARGKRTA